MPSILPPVFDEILAEPGNALLEHAADDGRAVIAYTCSYVPEALLSVDGLVPMRVRAPGVSGTPMADTYLSSVLCPYPRSVLELALEDRYDFVKGWVFTSCCDHQRRLTDNLVYLTSPPFVHTLDLPHKVGDAALAWYEQEVQALADALAEHFEVDTGEAAVAASIDRLNRQLAQLRAIGDLRKRERPPISGADFHRLVAASACAPRERLEDELAQVARTLDAHEGLDGHRARLLVVGSQLDDPSYIEVIESVGALVVADRLCFGSMPGLEPIDSSRPPLAALAAHSLRMTQCPRMMREFEARFAGLMDIIRDYRVDGVIVETLKFCDLWGYESAALVQALREAHVPVLRLEREYSLTGEGQLRTRVQAFLESMGR